MLPSLFMNGTLALPALLIAGLLSTAATAQSTARTYFSVPYSGAPAAHAPLVKGLVGVIDEANTRIRMAMLRLDLLPVVEALIRAHKRGVDVKVVTDDAARNVGFKPWYDALVKSGIPVRVDRGTVFNCNLHHKFFIIDDRTIWTGDWNSCWLDTDKIFHAALRIDSRGLAKDHLDQWQKLYDGERAGIEGQYTLPRVTHPVEGGGSARVHFGFEEDLEEVMVREIARAKATVDFAHAVFRNRRVAMALVAAMRRGVRVRLALGRDGLSRPLFQSCARFGAECRSAERPGIGCKFMVVDRQRLITGSWNCTIDTDHENIVVVEGVPRLLSGYLTYFASMLQRAEPWFKKGALAEDLTREHLMVRLTSTPGSKIATAALPWRGEVSAPPAPILVPEDAAVVPVSAAWPRHDRGRRDKHIAVTLHRRRALRPGARIRFVLSYTELHHSLGCYLPANHRPFVLDATAVGNLDRDLVLPFAFRLPPGHRKFHVELDQFDSGADGAWVWRGRWRLGPASITVIPGARVDRRDHIKIQRPLPFEQWTLNEFTQREANGLRFTAPWGGGFSPRLVHRPRKGDAILVRVTMQSDRQVTVAWYGMLGGKGKFPLPIIADGEPHDYVIPMDDHPAWHACKAIDRLHVLLGNEAPLQRLHEVAMGTLVR